MLNFICTHIKQVKTLLCVGQSVLNLRTIVIYIVNLTKVVSKLSENLKIITPLKIERLCHCHKKNQHPQLPIKGRGQELGIQKQNA